MTEKPSTAKPTWVVASSHTQSGSPRKSAVQYPGEGTPGGADIQAFIIQLGIVARHYSEACTPASPTGPIHILSWVT